MRTGPELNELGIRAASPVLNDLHHATLENDVEALRRAISNGTTPDLKVTNELTLLQLASLHGSADTVEALVDFGADPDLVTGTGHTALHLAAQNGDEKTVRALLKRANLYCTVSAQQMTPIHIAAAEGNTRALKALCEVADLEVKGQNGLTPLHHAVAKGHLEYVEILVQAGANIEATDKPVGATALITATWMDNPEMVRLLLSLGANIDATQSLGRTATSAAAYKGSVRAVKVLIGEGANLDIVDAEGYSALGCAILWSKPETALELLEKGVQLNTRFTGHQVTVLHDAISKCLHTVINKLLEKNIDLEACDSDGDTPLQWAVETGDVEIVKMLLNAKADINKSNSKTGWTLLCWAIVCGHVEVTRILLSHGATTGKVELDVLEPRFGTTEDDFSTCRKLLSGQIPIDKPEKSTESEIAKQQDFPVPVNDDMRSDPADPLENAPDVSQPYRYDIHDIHDIPSQLAKRSAIAPYQDQVEHKSITCDGPYCKTKSPLSNIRGIRYKCTMCENIDYCARCLASFENSHTTFHPMIRCFLPTELRLTRKIDSLAKEELLKNNDVSIERSADVESALVAVLIEREPDSHLPESLFEHEEPFVFLLAPSQEKTQRPPRKGIVKYNEKTLSVDTASETGIVWYDIDDDLGVRVKHVGLGAKPEAKMDQEVVLHHQDPKLLLDVMFTGKVKVFDYRSQAEFYSMVNEGHLVTRVVDVLPGKFDDKLDIRLRVVDTSKAKYYALSYTWKETKFERENFSKWDKAHDEIFRQMANAKHAVYVQNDQDQTYLTIGTGLRDALKRLRSPTEVITLWTDQISINQTHLEERAFQVARMRYTFNQAAKTVVWIGEEDQYTGAVFDTLRKLAVASRMLSYNVPPEALLEDENLDLPSLESPVWRAVIEHLSRPVFSRCWVIQEIVVAQKVVVQCGQHAIVWEDFARGAICLAETGWIMSLDKIHRAIVDNQKALRAPLKPAIIEVITMNGMREDFQSLKELSMETLIYITGTFKASDTRDRIYSLLGIQGARKRPEESIVQPDYTRSIEQTSIEATKAIPLESQSFSICGLIDHAGGETKSSIPSWVPDYSVVKDKSTIFSRPLPASPYAAAGDSCFMVIWPYDEYPGLLATSSYKVNTVVQVSDRTFPTDSDNERGKVIEDWTRMASTQPKYVTGEEISKAFTATLVGDCKLRSRETPPPSTYHIAIATQLSHEYFSYLLDLGELNNERPMYGVMHQLLLDAAAANAQRAVDIDPDAVPTMIATSANRKFFLAYNGYFGIGPANMQPGDEIHILGGTKVPFVLRRLVNAAGESKAATLADLVDRPLYTMVGECYLHGIMKGEAVKGDDVEWNEIYLY